MVNIGCPYSTGSPFLTKTSRISKDCSALISFITFIASMMHKVVSGVTKSPALQNGSASGDEAD
jgi:hypothetical protein